MKKQRTLLLLLLTAAMQLFAPTDGACQLSKFPNYYASIDTTANADTVTLTLTKNVVKEPEASATFWHITATGLTDTTTYTILHQVSLDKNEEVWVTDYTVANAANTLAADVYFFMAPNTGYNQRVVITTSGSSTTALFKCFTVTRNVPNLTTWDVDDLLD